MVLVRGNPVGSQVSGLVRTSQRNRKKCKARRQEIECRRQNTGHRIQKVGTRIQDTGDRNSDKLRVPGYEKSNVKNLRLNKTKNAGLREKRQGSGKSPVPVLDWFN